MPISTLVTYKKLPLKTVLSCCFCQASAFHDRTSSVSRHSGVAPTLQLPPLWIRKNPGELTGFEQRLWAINQRPEICRCRWKFRFVGNGYQMISVIVSFRKLSFHTVIPKNKESESCKKNPWTPIWTIDATGAKSSPPRCKTSTDSTDSTVSTGPTSPTSAFAGVSVTISTSVSSCFRFLELWHSFSRELYETDAASIISSYAKWGQCCLTKDANFIKPAELPPDSMKDTSSPLKAVKPKPNGPNALRQASATGPTGPTGSKSTDAESSWATAFRSILPPGVRKRHYVSMVVLVISNTYGLGGHSSRKLRTWTFCWITV